MGTLREFPIVRRELFSSPDGRGNIAIRLQTLRSATGRVNGGKKGFCG
jgi:hypothetical protein